MNLILTVFYHRCSRIKRHCVKSIQIRTRKTPYLGTFRVVRLQDVKDNCVVFRLKVTKTSNFLSITKYEMLGSNRVKQCI